MVFSAALPRLPVVTSRSRTGVLGLVGRLVQAATEPVPAGSAAVFRIAFGLLGVAMVLRFVANGWISEVYVEPAHHFSYYGFGWVRAWPGWGMHAHFALLGLASLGVALGYRYRLSIAAFFLLFTYIELIDKTTYLNHYYFVSLMSLLMVFLPLHRSWSLDARRGPIAQRPSTIPRGVLWMLRAQIGLVYVFAGIAKLNPDWLLHADPLRIWLYNTTDTPLIGFFVRETWMAYAMSWAGAFFDLTIVGWLLWRKSRPFAYVILVAFHVATGVLFPSIGMFPWIMIGATLLFFDPDWPARLSRRTRGASAQTTAGAPISTPPTEARPLSWPVRAALVLGRSLPGSAVAGTPEAPGLPRKRAVDGGGLPILLEGAGNGEDRPGEVPGNQPGYGRRAPGPSGRVPDAPPGGALCAPAGHGPGRSPHHPRRLHRQGARRGGSPRRRIRDVQRSGSDAPD